MLPPFIIEQIRRREEQDRVRHEQPQLDIPAIRPPQATPTQEEKAERGVIVIDLMGD
jgi:hypothetical protein